MKTAHLLSTVAATLVFAVGTVGAQTSNDHGSIGPAAVPKSAASEKRAPSPQGDARSAQDTAPQQQRGPGGFSPLESSPANGGINLPNSTSQDAPAVAPNLSAEQRNKIIAIFRDYKVVPAHLDIPVHVGAQIPADVTVHPIPDDVVSAFPDWRGYGYIMVADEVLIIDPDSHQIVAILIG